MKQKRNFYRKEKVAAARSAASRAVFQGYHCRLLVEDDLAKTLLTF